MDGYSGGGFGSREHVPVQVGDELDVKIEAVGEKGDGIAKKDGFVLFVPGVKEGDEVRIRVTKVLAKVGFAEVVGEAQDEVAPADGEEAAEEAPEEPAEEEAGDTEEFGEEAPAEESEEFGKEEKES